MTVIIREQWCLSWKTVHKAKWSNDFANMQMKIRRSFVCLFFICLLKICNNLRLPKILLRWGKWNSKREKILVFSHYGTIFWTLFDGEPAGVVSVVFSTAPAELPAPSMSISTFRICSCVKTDWNFLWAKNQHVSIHIFINEEVFHPLAYATLLCYKHRLLFCIDSIRLWCCLKKKCYPVFELQSHSYSFSADKLSVI